MDITNPPVNHPVIDVNTGLVTDVWAAWLIKLATIIRGL